MVGDCHACLFQVRWPLLSIPSPTITPATNAPYSAAWTSYDKVFKPTFGDGERTIGETDDDLNEKAPLIRNVIERYGVGGRMGGQMQDDSAVGPKSADDELLLQDYQMRLRLLEQQNKTRLMMARQEQDNQVDRDGVPVAGMGGTMIGGDRV